MVLKYQCLFRMSFDQHTETGQERLGGFAALKCCNNVTGSKPKLMWALPISDKQVVIFLFWYSSNLLHASIWWWWFPFYSLVLHQYNQVGFSRLSLDLHYWKTEDSFLRQNTFHTLFFIFLLFLFIPCGILWGFGNFCISSSFMLTHVFTDRCLICSETLEK